MKKMVLISIFFMIIVAFTNSITVWIIKDIINKVFIAKSKSFLTLIAIVMSLTMITKAISRYIQDIIMNFITTDISVSLQHKLFKKYIKLPISEINKLQNGEFMTYVGSDTGNIIILFRTIIVNFVRELLTVTLLTGMVFYTNFKLACFSFIFFPFSFYILIKISKSIRQRVAKLQEDVQKINVRLIDFINGIITIKSYNSEHFETKRIFLLIKQQQKKLNSIQKKASIGSPMMEMFSSVSIFTVFVYGGLSVINGNADAGSFFSFITALLMSYKPIKGLSSTSTFMQNAIVSINRIQNFLSKEEEDIDKGYILDIKNQDINIKFKNVKFKYKNDEDYIINDISFDIKSGQKIAFVGESGSGKSTITSLLLGLYDINNGDIFINEKNIKEISKASLRRNISYVPQDGFLFHQDLNYNIKYNTYHKKNIQDVINDTKIDFINTIDKENKLFELSFGQRQRIAIARSIYKDSPMLIFDESTSALDNNTEQDIKNLIYKKLINKTIVIVAHRLQMIVNCDTIFVIDKGKIVESGNHIELLKKEGYYKKLWEKTY